MEIDELDEKELSRFYAMITDQRKYWAARHYMMCRLSQIPASVKASADGVKLHILGLVARPQYTAESRIFLGNAVKDCVYWEDISGDCTSDVPGVRVTGICASLERTANIWARLLSEIEQATKMRLWQRQELANRGARHRLAEVLEDYALGGDGRPA